MIATFAIAIAAGCASALMFASFVSGAVISLVLAYLSLLPLMVAGIGWGPRSAAIGGTAAVLGLGATLGPFTGISYAVLVALPAWWLGHLAMLARPTGGDAEDGSQSLEWYPIGRILLWIAGFAVLITIAMLLIIAATDADATAAAMKRLAIHVFDVQGIVASEFMIDAVAASAPAAIPVGPVIMLTVNLWLAAKTTAISGHLHRPWPDLRATALSPMTLVALCVAIAFCFTGGFLAIFAKVIAGALLIAYAFTGFAVVHTLTLALRNRMAWLIACYVLTIVTFWPLPAIVVLGIVDAVSGVRERLMRTRMPPPLPAS